jgi:hypothetical protein
MPLVRTTEDRPSIRTSRFDQLVEEFFLLKENGGFLLLEDGGKIIETRREFGMPPSINIKEIPLSFRNKQERVGMRVGGSCGVSPNISMKELFPSLQNKQGKTGIRMGKSYKTSLNIKKTSPSIKSRSEQTGIKVREDSPSIRVR